MISENTMLGWCRCAWGLIRRQIFALPWAYSRSGARGANIVCLPELFRAQYFCQREDLRLFDLAEPIPGPVHAKLGEVAREAARGRHCSLLCLSGARRGFITTRPSRLNADGASPASIARCTSPTIRSTTRSITFARRSWVFRPSIRSFGRVGTLVCWDQWYPEGARLTALQGAEVLFYPTAIGWHPAEKDEFGAAQYDAWQTIQRAHAIANGVYVAGVNRVGHENGDVKAIASKARASSSGAAAFSPIPLAASSPRPRTTRRDSAGRDRPALIEETRRNWPFLRDRRIDAYAPITHRFLDPDPGHSCDADGDSK
jgi:N-carbamoylputrescine amidase